MRAVLSHESGGPETLVIEERPSPTAGKGNVVIDVKAVGVNFPDSLIIQDLYQIKPPRPFAPGGELAGVVKEVGEGVTELAIGDRVLSFPGWGAMVTEIEVSAGSTSRIPDGMPFDEAAAFLMTYGTSQYALKNRAGVKAGETLFILGAAGGVGLAAVQLAKSMGMKVIAGCSTQDKVDLCLSHGADAGVVYPRQPLDRDQQKALSNQIKEAGGGGVDVIYDAVGGDYAEPSLRAMNWEGRYLVVGFPAGIPKIPLNLTLLKSCQIVGVFWGAFVASNPDGHTQNVAELFELYGNGRIKPFISSRYTLDQAGEAITELVERRATGKIVIEI